MNVYRSASRAYAAVNVAGKFNDMALDTDNLLLGAVASRGALHRHRTDRLQRRLGADAPESLRVRVGHVAADVRDASSQFCSSLRATMGINLAVQRSIPWLWLPGGSLFSAVRYANAAPLFPLGELLVGRGNSNSHPPFMLQGVPFRIFRHFGEAQHRYAHHGLAGYVLEAAPLKAAHKADMAQKHILAGACMIAAVIGRVVLQPMRLAVAGAAFGNELFQTIFMVAVAAGAEITCRLVRLSLVKANEAVGLPSAAAQRVLSAVIQFCVVTRDGFIVGLGAEVDIAQERMMERDDGSPGVNNRVRARTTRLLRRFEGVEALPLDADGNEDPRQLRQAGEIAAQLADELRAYCIDLPTNEALRGGLALLRDFVEITWGAEAIGYHPPELAEAAPQAA